MFLFQHDNNWFIGGDEDYFDRASELFNTAIDSLVHRTLQITRKSDDIDMSELESSWPLVLTGLHLKFKLYRYTMYEFWFILCRTSANQI